MNIEVLKRVLKEAQRGERHNTNAETRYWCSQYKAIAEKAIAALAEQPAQQEPVAPKCGAIIEVFGKDWRLDYMSLPVGKHKLYTQQYTYTAPPQRKPLTDEEIIKCWGQVSGTRYGYVAFARAIEAAHGIKENT